MVTNKEYDLIVVGAGSAGMATTIFAGDAGLTVLVLDCADRPGGTLQVATGQMSAAGTRLQRERGIVDDPQLHYTDVMRISRSTADPALVRTAVFNAAATFDWLVEKGYEPLPDHPVLGDTHEPYSVPRYYWGAEWGRSILAVVRPEFERVAALDNVDVRFGIRVTGLEGGRGGAPVTAVLATGPDGESLRFVAANVVMATGGYNGDPRVFAERSGRTLVASSSYAFARGDGHTIIEALGGRVSGAEKFLCSFGQVLESYEYPARAIYRPEHRPERRQPWEISVNLLGERFLAEDEPSVDAREHALVAQPEARRFIVFDSRIKAEAPTMFPGIDDSEIDALYGRHPMFLVADSLDALATKMGVPADALTATVEEYNRPGRDVWGRTHKPLPIEQGPFYAISVHGVSITSTAGVEIDSDFHVLVDGTTPVPNLYAYGEIIGAGRTMGNSFCGGMMATPAMTFGRLLAGRLAAAGGVLA